ncbi:CPBP family intramembrane glutamic endopeptidase [Dactylosporangium sp. NPDC050588]|uniref:CPBP family intramembrane glutamic endopeptidase n=1 Tax=Dactylosporangium sp. NPDC050588 TaxID=3157211 RepID=UPI00340BF4C4
MFEWVTPGFDPAATVLVLLVALVTTAGGVRAATAKARAARERLVATPGGRIRLYRGGIITSIALTLAASAVAATDGVGLAALGLRPVGAGDVALAAGVSAWFALVVVVNHARFARARRDGARTPGRRGGEEALARIRFLQPVTAAERWLAGLLSVSVGIGEEVVYRGLFIAAGVGILGLDAWVAAGLSLLLFGAAHLYQGWRGVLGATVLGSLFTLLYDFTGGLFAPIVVHAVFDVAALVAGPLVARWVERRPPSPAATPAPGPAAAPAAGSTAPAPAAASPAAAPAASPAASPAVNPGPLTLRSATPE